MSSKSSTDTKMYINLESCLESGVRKASGADMNTKPGPYSTTKFLDHDTLTDFSKLRMFSESVTIFSPGASYF